LAKNHYNNSIENINIYYMLMHLAKVSICRTIASWHDQDFREHYGCFPNATGDRLRVSPRKH